MRAGLRIIYMDRHLVVVNKPGGILSLPAQEKRPNMLDLTKNYVKQIYPGHLFLGAIHRLDYAVSGALCFAKTVKAARRLSDFFRRSSLSTSEELSMNVKFTSSFKKLYIAAVRGHARGESGKMTHLIERNLDTRKASKVKILRYRTDVPERVGFDYQKAVLEWRVLAQSQNFSLLEVTLITGRRHQIRAQLSFESMPIIGDWLYGDDHTCSAHEAFASNNSIALHSSCLIIPHPIGANAVNFKAPVPKLWSEVFGDAVISRIS